MNWIKIVRQKSLTIVNDKIRDGVLQLEIAELDRNTELKHTREEGFDEGEKNGNIKRRNRKIKN